jgi:hypothetical protein
MTERTCETCENCDDSYCCFDGSRESEYPCYKEHHLITQTKAQIREQINKMIESTKKYNNNISLAKREILEELLEAI